jgi:hypothetical protein
VDQPTRSIYGRSCFALGDANGFEEAGVSVCDEGTLGRQGALFVFWVHQALLLQCCDQAALYLSSRRRVLALTLALNTSECLADSRFAVLIDIGGHGVIDLHGMPDRLPGLIVH